MAVPLNADSGLFPLLILGEHGPIFGMVYEEPTAIDDVDSATLRFPAPRILVRLLELLEGGFALLEGDSGAVG